jgi:hypothetical protein
MEPQKSIEVDGYAQRKRQDQRTKGQQGGGRFLGVTSSRASPLLFFFSCWGVLTPRVPSKGVGTSEKNQHTHKTKRTNGENTKEQQEGKQGKSEQVRARTHI